MSMSATDSADLAFGKDEVISRKELKPFTRRTDWHGLTYLAVHMSALVASGVLLYLSLGTWWVVPAMLLHAFVMTNIYTPVHDCSHGTVFRTRWLNESVYRFLSLIYIWTPLYYRYRHAMHHTYTQVRGKERDPDIILSDPHWISGYLYYATTIPYWKRQFTWLGSHALGIKEPADHYFIPDDEWPRIFREARYTWAVYAAIAAAAIYFGSWAPVIYWLLPRFIGEPFRRWNNLTEHCGLPEGPDLRENTRTTLTWKWLEAVVWNMNYHAEHHISPQVPFHALPALHEKIGDKLHHERGLINVHLRTIRYYRDFARQREAAAPQQA